MFQISLNNAAFVLTLPPVLVPTIGVPLVVWARQRFILLNPDYFAHPPTISRAISDPRIGGLFADAVLLITALICITITLVVAAYTHSISSLPIARTARIAMYVTVAAFAATQAVASTGMVVTSEYTLTNNRSLHMLGSYLFFAAQTVSILLAAILCRSLLYFQQEHRMPEQRRHFRRKMQNFRFWLGLGIVPLTFLYGVLFIIKDWVLPINLYAIRIAYTQCEVMVIICFAMFLGSYAIDTYSMIKRGIAT